MIPRRRIDIGWGDLARGIAACLLPAERESAAISLESRWGQGDVTVATLSVRSGFDALLQACAFPAGSEVLMSAVNIRDMARIVEAHGLVPVPVDVDPDTLAVSTVALSAAVTPRTRAVLIAHLYGSRMPMDGIVAVARERNLLLLEDCAESWTGDGWLGDERADVRLFSFGPIKTATALAGGLLLFRDAALCGRVRAVQAGWPVQSRLGYLARLIKYGGICVVATRPVFTLLAFECRLLRLDLEHVIGESTRGFAGGEFFAGIRRQPCAPLLELLDHRLRHYDGAPVRQRVAMAETAARLLPAWTRPGAAAPSHTHWLFPVVLDNPDGLMRHLREHGFDATRGATSLGTVAAPSGRTEPLSAQRMLERVLYLPVHEGMAAEDVERLAVAMRLFAGQGAATMRSTSGGHHAEPSPH